MSCAPRGSVILLRPCLLTSKALVAVVLVFILVFLQPGRSASTLTAQETGTLRIAVLKGNHQIRKRGSDLELLIEVRDGSNNPVSGAEVSFVAPEDGPGLLFPDNTNHLTVTTDSHGRANIGPTRAVGGGAYTINITASFQGQTATISAQAVNPVPGESTAEPKKKSGAMKWILLAAAGGAAGVVVATKKSSTGSSTSGASGSGGATITAGSPIVGAPR